MKVFERPKSATRSMTPKRILSQKPPVPKLIQKKPKTTPRISVKELNKENLPLEMILPEDVVLIKPNEINNQSLYTQSPIGELHICFPYELPSKNPKFEISTKTHWEASREIAQTFGSTPSVARNNRVKLLSKNFKINKTALTKYCKGSSQNSTPEPRDH